MAVPPAAALQLIQDFQQLQAHRAELYSDLSKGFRDFLGHGQEGHLARLMAADITPGFAAVSQQVREAIESCLRSSAVGRPDLAGLLRQVQELERDKLRLTLSWQALRAAHASGRFSWQSEADRPRLSQSTGKQQQQQQQDVTSKLEQMQLQARTAAATPVSSDVAAVGGPDQHVGGPHHQQQVDGFMSVKPGFYEQQLQQAAAAAAVAEHAEQVQQQQDGSSGGEQGHSDGHGCCGHGHGHDHDHGPPDPLDAGTAEPTEAEYNAAVREALQQLDDCVLGINDVLQEVQEAVADLQQEA
ncbi:DNA repair REX1-B-domain-containing protein [Scenedesmus sp. NREL 46B-D3]|nr:DNA repair REX1-B-domain-containing protein [Scenedesmus sp. NREL 46B-D3]